MKINFVFMTALVLVSGCSKEQTLEHNQNVTYSKGVYSLPETLDPIKMTDTASLLVSNFIYSGLLKISTSLQLKGDLAESWSISEDGKTYTFTLRQNAKFHDGSLVTPENVVNSLTRAVSRFSTVYKYYDCIKGADEYYLGKATMVTGLRKVSVNSVSIELKYPFPPFLSVLAGATAKILPSTDRKNFFQHPIGSGPFQLVSIDRESSDRGQVVLKRFSSYQGDQPKIETLILKARTEKEALAEAAKGQIDDLASFPLAPTEAIFNKGKDVVAPIAATWIIGLNSRIAPFNNQAFRKAFKSAVDTEGFRKKFYPDALPATSYIPNGMQGYRDEVPEAFKAKPAISKTKIEIAFPSVLAHEKEMRQFLEKNLRDQGWNVTFKPMDWDKLLAAYQKKTLQGFVLSMNMDYPDTEFLVRNFESTNPDNFSGLKDAALDTLIRNARATDDRAVRAKIYENIVTKLEDQAVTVNLFYPRSHSWVSRCVKGFIPNILADYYIDYSTVEKDSNCLTSGESS